MGTDDRVELQRVRPFDPFDSVIVFDGVRLSDGGPVSLAVDHRPARQIREALADGGTITVRPQPWQIIGGT